MSAILAAAALIAATPPVIEAPIERCPEYPGEENVIPLGRRHVNGSPPTGAEALGDAWEMEEVACWRGTWLRRGRTNIFDGYWTHPTGERVRATLEMWRKGRAVTVVRRQERGQYCRYDGTISEDWWFVEGRYTCTWERTPMRWHARIVRLPEVLPYVLQD